MQSFTVTQQGSSDTQFDIVLRNRLLQDGVSFFTDDSLKLIKRQYSADGNTESNSVYKAKNSHACSAGFMLNKSVGFALSRAATCTAVDETTIDVLLIREQNKIHP